MAESMLQHKALVSSGKRLVFIQQHLSEGGRELSIYLLIYFILTTAETLIFAVCFLSPTDSFVCILLTVFESPAFLQGVYSQTDANSFFSGASRSSVIQCKPGGNCPSRHRGMTRQLSPLSVAEDSAAPILELQNRSPSGICRHSRVERQSRSGRHNGRAAGVAACLLKASPVWFLERRCRVLTLGFGAANCMALWKSFLYLCADWG